MRRLDQNKKRVGKRKKRLLSWGGAEKRQSGQGQVGVGRLAGGGRLTRVESQAKAETHLRMTQGQFVGGAGQ